jgi:hypothetical protein
MPDTFRALIAEGDSKQYSVDFKDIPHGSLPAGEVLIPPARCWNQTRASSKPGTRSS